MQIIGNIDDNIYIKINKEEQKNYLDGIALYLELDKDNCPDIDNIYVLSIDRLHAEINEIITEKEFETNFMEDIQKYRILEKLLSNYFNHILGKYLELYILKS